MRGAERPGSRGGVALTSLAAALALAAAVPTTLACHRDEQPPLRVTYYYLRL
jgi:hypothetical protein